MKSRILPVAVLSVVLTLGAGILPSASADDPPVDPPPPPPVTQPLRIMLAGDSITQGFDGDYTWRYRLVKEFVRQGVDVDFVGPRRYTYGGSNHYLVPSTGPTAWDSDHDAIGGTSLTSRVPHIGADVAAYSPDILVSELGTTDMIHGATVAGVVAAWRRYIANAQAAHPGIKIVLGEVTSIRVPKRAALNAAVRALAAQVTASSGMSVTVYDMTHSAWRARTDTYDGTHPTPTGETLIAQRVAWALKALGALPQDPKIWRLSLPWPPTFTPVIRFDRRHRLVVGWAGAKRRNEAQQMRLRITSLRSGRTAPPTPWTWASREVRALPPGRYTISLRGMRGTMASTWGRPIAVRVPRR
ncbi:MAG: SGNH/GDSL hydrolase family protein [Marmoricola sp.]